MLALIITCHTKGASPARLRSVKVEHFETSLVRMIRLLSVLLLQVKRTYSQGTYRAGAMRQVSLVGAVDEEVGDYFPEFISMLEDSPFLEVCMSLFMSVYTCAISRLKN